MKTTPKYAGALVAGGMIAGPLVGLTTLAAGVMAGALTDKVLKDRDALEKAKVAPSELKNCYMRKFENRRGLFLERKRVSDSLRRKLKPSNNELMKLRN